MGRPEESVLPPPEAKAGYVRGLFQAIAPWYDALNHLLSLNRDRAWRRRAVDRLDWSAHPDGLYLDACTGTFDLALELARRPGFHGRVVATDFAPAMLRQGQPKIGAAAIRPLAADTLRLPFADATFHGATVGFGVRNLADLDAGLRELVRVLRPGGRLVVLDFALPPRGLLRAGYLLYFRRVLPTIGRLVSGHASAYRYLPESVLRFPEPPELARRLEAAGLRGVGWELRTAGVVAIHWGRRPG